MAIWSYLLYASFPIPLFSLVLMSIPYPPSLEKFGNSLVHKIFFTQILSNGMRLVHLFTLVSLVVFLNSSYALSLEAEKCRTCATGNEIYWYSKAMKWRTERNFWISFMNVFLWVLIWRIHSLKGRCIQMKEENSELKKKLVAATEAATAATLKVEVSSATVEVEAEEAHSKKSKTLKKNE